MPNPDAASDAEWADYVFNRNGAPGVRAEWWYHLPSGTWFIAERDTLRDEFLRTYLYGVEAERSCEAASDANQSEAKPG